MQQCEWHVYELQHQRRFSWQCSEISVTNCSEVLRKSIWFNLKQAPEFLDACSSILARAGPGHMNRYELPGLRKSSSAENVIPGNLGCVLHNDLHMHVAIQKSNFLKDADIAKHIWKMWWWQPNQFFVNDRWDSFQALWWCKKAELQVLL